MPEASDTVDVLVVGAGMAGLTAARHLKQAGRSVRVLDKGRGFGGRMAHRRGDDGQAFDHGAQFFTARDDRFKAMVDAWIAEGVATEWHRLPATANHPEPLIRYRGTPGMTAPAKFLAEGLNVCRSCQVEALERANSGWSVRAKDGRHFHGRWLLLTPPPPQALNLLGDAHAALLTAAQLEFLRGVHYERTLAALVQLDGPSALEAPGLRKGDLPEPLELIADNYLKGVSTRPGTLTLHANAAYSEKHYDSPDETRLPPLLEAARPFFGDSPVADARVHRWGYATPLNAPHPDRCLMAEAAQLAFAGDAFGGARVEGPALSGLAVAERLLAL
ncbi:MAG: NAD(P)/FAD-dependent oxidoreductase [Opitutales bacterium]